MPERGRASGQPARDGFDRAADRLRWMGRFSGFSIVSALSVLVLLERPGILVFLRRPWDDMMWYVGIDFVCFLVALRYEFAGALLALAIVGPIYEDWRYFFDDWFFSVLSLPGLFLSASSLLRRPRWFSPTDRHLMAVLGPDVSEGLRQFGRLLGTAATVYFLLGFLPSHERKFCVLVPAEAGVLLAGFAYFAGLLWAWAWPRSGGCAALTGLMLFALLKGPGLRFGIQREPLLTLALWVLFVAPPILLLLSGCRDPLPAPGPDVSDPDEARPGRLRIGVLVLLTLALLAVAAAQMSLV